MQFLQNNVRILQLKLLINFVNIKFLFVKNKYYFESVCLKQIINYVCFYKILQDYYFGLKVKLHKLEKLIFNLKNFYEKKDIKRIN